MYHPMTSINAKFILICQRWSTIESPPIPTPDLRWSHETSTFLAGKSCDRAQTKDFGQGWDFLRIWGFPWSWGNPQNRWFIMEKIWKIAWKYGWLGGYSYFRQPPFEDVDVKPTCAWLIISYQLTWGVHHEKGHWNHSNDWVVPKTSQNKWWMGQ